MTKKIFRTGALAAVLLFGFTACSSSTVSVTPYWYKDASGGMENTRETLTYRVFLSSETNETPSNETYSLSYEEGTYTVELINTTFDNAAVGASAAYNGRSVYRLTSSLAIGGTYTFGEETKTFADSVESVCYFLSAENALRPVYSVKTVHSTSPANETPASLEECYAEYDYSVVCDYGSLTYNYTDNADETKNKSGTIDEASGLFIDNEELLFAARGLDLSSSNTARVFNPYLGATESITISAATEYTADDGLTLTFTDEDSAAEKTISAFNGVYFARNATVSGGSTTVYYATTDDEGENYRNALVYMISPLPYNLGYLRYVLNSADFCDR